MMLIIMMMIMGTCQEIANAKQFLRKHVKVDENKKRLWTFYLQYSKNYPELIFIAISYKMMEF